MANKLRWRLRSGEIDEYVYAPDQFAAFDMLRDRAAEDFGCIVIAELDGGLEEGWYPCRTSLLMFSWFRDEDARRFVRRMMAEGMPDLTDADLVAAGRK